MLQLAIDVRSDKDVNVYEKSWHSCY